MLNTALRILEIITCSEYIVMITTYISFRFSYRFNTLEQTLLVTWFPKVTLKPTKY